jgi:UDP-N-acetylmuramoyl-L-alanyl-D-glutamate--2,6-diaminopimelate ligase
MAWWQLSQARAIGEIPDIPNLTHDSRLVQPGWGFAAIPGREADGHTFIARALEAGAAACVVQAGHEQVWAPYRSRVPMAVVPDVREALGHLAAAVHGAPSSRLRTIGVTGTDGKTTSTHLIAHVLDQCGLGCGYLSSVGFDRGAGFELNAFHMTTLEATSIQSMLADALTAGRQSMVVEASSEGLAQGRLNGCEIDVAVFTNLTRDHLDFHGTMERYLEAKGMLFRKLDEPTQKRFPRTAIVNADDPASEYLKTLSSAPVLTYGIADNADFRTRDVTVEGFGLRFDVEHAQQTVAANVPLIGRFNAYNSLAAVAVACSQGVSLTEAVSEL